jgi:hypothetical protein
MVYAESGVQVDVLPRGDLGPQQPQSTEPKYGEHTFSAEASSGLCQDGKWMLYSFVTNKMASTHWGSRPRNDELEVHGVIILLSAQKPTPRSL